MPKWTIPMYGLQREITELRQVDVELPEGATMPQVIAAMREKIPSLEGPVIRPGEDRLAIAAAQFGWCSFKGKSSSGRYGILAEEIKVELNTLINDTR